MTYEELDALPEDGFFDFYLKEIDGKTWRIPVYRTVGPLWREDHEPRGY